MKNMKVLAVLAGVFLLFSAGTSSADVVLDFGLQGETVNSTPTSFLSYAGGASPLVGTHISAFKVFDLNNTSKTYNVQGYLNFTTGPNTGGWNWGGGNTSSIILNGIVDVNNNGTFGDAGDINGDLLTGQFGKAEVAYQSGTFKILGADFSDTKNADLLTLFGINPPGFDGNLNLSFTANVSSGQFTSTTVGSGDLFNTPVPEPGTMLLLGSGLVGLAGWGRKKFRK